jgi:hypothetical protein
MDQAWALEREFWQETSKGNATSFYARHMTADGFVVLPNRVVTRNELLTRWAQLRPLRSFELSEPTYTVIEGGNVVITYHVSVDAEWLPDYRAHMTALYVAVASGWALVFRAHTPEAGFPF